MSRSTVADESKRGGSDEQRRRDLDYATPLLRAPWTGPRIARWLGGAYLALTLIGILALRLPGATIRGNELSFERCVFTAVNAATLTGFQQAVPLDQFGVLGQAIVLLLMVSGTLFTLIIGGIALNRAVKMPYTDLQVAWTALFVYVFCLG